MEWHSPAAVECHMTREEWTMEWNGRLEWNKDGTLVRRGVKLRPKYRQPLTDGRKRLLLGKSSRDIDRRSCRAEVLDPM